MTKGWCVRVSVFDDLIVSISERELCGRDLSESDEDLIRACAQHLLSFVGSTKPRCRDGYHRSSTSGYGHQKCHICGLEWDFYPPQRSESAPSVAAVDPSAGNQERGPRA